MNLRKWLCTCVAVASASIALAGNTSDLKMYIDSFFSFIEVAEESGQLTAEDQAMLQTSKALRAGLLNYEKNVTAQTLTDTDKAIAASLDSNIPNILNSMQKSVSEIEEPLKAELLNLAALVSKNQKEIPQAAVDQESAGAILFSFAYLKAYAEGSLLGRVSTILSQAAMESGLLNTPAEAGE